MRGLVFSCLGLLLPEESFFVGTRVTFLPDQDIFGRSFEFPAINEQAAQLTTLYPKLKLQVFSD